MSLADLMRKGGLRRVATLTVATVATHEAKDAVTVAVVATVAVANLPDHKAAPAEAIDTVPVSAAPDPDRWCWPHSDAMTGAEVDTFTGRLALFKAKGLTLTEAEALADKLVIRDRDGDDMRACLECSHLSGWNGRRQCRGLEYAGMGGPLVSAGQVAMLQRCNGFKGGGSMTKPKKPALIPTPVPNHLPVVRQEGETLPHALANSAIRPTVNAALVVHAYQENLLGKDTSLAGLMDGLAASMSKGRDGDLSTLEAMLIGQATALQSIFTSLALRAQAQTSQRNLEAFLGLALKAQAQSRATITALVDLKHPKQAMFVKQANIANGNQQVNNGVPAEPERSAQAHRKETKKPVIELLEAPDGKFGKGLDTRAATAPARGHPAMAAVESVHRANKHRR